MNTFRYLVLCGLAFCASCTDPAKVEQDRYLQAISSNDILILEEFIETYPKTEKFEKVQTRLDNLTKQAEADKWIGQTATKEVKGNWYAHLNGKHYYNVLLTGVIEDYNDGRIKVLINDIQMTTNANNIFALTGFNNSWRDRAGKSYYWEISDEDVSVD